MKITNRLTNETIIEGDYNTMLEAVAACMSSGKSLYGANLTGANLTGENLTGADLTGAKLTDANLYGADLYAANLTGAKLTGADLTGADLTGAKLYAANLTPIRDDIWAVLSSSPLEVAGLIDALKNGRVDGSSYSGECACLVGTIAAVRHCGYEEIESLKPNPCRAAERFFLPIKPGHTPDNSQFAKLACEWCEEWLARMTAAFAPKSDASL